MTAHPTLQHDDVSGHLLVLSMAKLWKGGAAAAAALCRHLSLFGMCTVVRGDRLHGLVTDHRGLSREHGQDDAKACRRRRRRRIVQATCSKPRTASGSLSAGGGFGVPTNRLDAHFGLSADLANGGLLRCKRKQLQSWHPNWLSNVNIDTPAPSPSAGQVFGAVKEALRTPNSAS